MITKIDSEQLKAEFQSVLDETNNKTVLINRELEAINKFIYEKPERLKPFKIPVFKFRSVFEPSKLYNGTLYPFKETFDNLLMNGNSGFTEHDLNENQTAFFQNANALFEYYNWLNSINQKPVKRNETTLSQIEKILVLHYLGVKISSENMDEDYSKTARLLQPIIQMDWKESRKLVKILHHEDEKIKTKSRLNKLIKYFDNEGYTYISNKIRDDLSKIK